MKISFEIIDKGNGRIDIHDMLIDGKVSHLIISVLPSVFGRIMGSIIRDCFKDPMAGVKLPKIAIKVFKATMEDEIHGTEPMFNKNSCEKGACE